MRLLSLDYEPLFGTDSDTLSTFGSDISVFDYDVVFWDPEKSFDNYSHYDTYMGLPSLADFASSQIMADVQRRGTEFREFIEAGRVLVVVARPPQTCYVQTGRSEYSGTGRNARKTNFVEQFDIWSALPADSIGLQKARGDRIEAFGDGALQGVMRKYVKDLAYTATMSSPPGTAIATVAGTSRRVASFLTSKGGGALVIIPDTTFVPSRTEEGEIRKWPKKATDFQVDLLEAIESLIGSSEVARPSWASDYSTASQREARAAIKKQQAIVTRARNKLATLQADAEAADLRDQLYLGTGRQLELRVKDVLEQLDCTVTEPAPGRDDWKVEFGKYRAVVEIKGVGKSAAEKHAAQLEKWVAGELEETGKTPKAILVVNTWREVPLADRSGEDFPSQMLPYCESRGHCLVTGLDLFVIACDVDDNPNRAKYWREKLLSTVGRLEDVPDWRDFVERAESEVAEE